MSFYISINRSFCEARIISQLKIAFARPKIFFIFFFSFDRLFAKVHSTIRQAGSADFWQIAQLPGRFAQLFRHDSLAWLRLL